MIDLKSLVSGTASARDEKLTYIALTVCVAVLWIAHATLPLVFPVDDAYITLHNASVVAGASDVNYGVSGFVGATSPLHVLLTALFALVMPAARALHTVMWLGALAYVLGIARLAFVHKASVGQTLVCVLVACAIAEVPHQLMNGLETGWTMAALVWTLGFASQGLARGRVTAALCGVLPLLRPELLVVSVLVLAVQATQRLEDTPRREALREIAIDAGIAAAVILPFALLLWIATGSPIPGTVSAKRHFFAEGCMQPAVKRMWLFNNLWAFSGLLGLLSPALALLALTRLGRAGLLFIAALLFAYYREFPGALAHYEHRYMYPIVPFVMFGAITALRHSLRVVRLATIGMLLVTALLASWAAPAAWRRHMSYVGFTTDELATVAAWSRDHMPADARVLVHDAGYIAAATNLALVDVVGLKTPLAAEAHARLTWPTCGARRGDAIAEIAARTNPDYLIVLKGWERIFRIGLALAQHGWRIQKVRPVADAGYEIYKLTRATSESGPSSP